MQDLKIASRYISKATNAKQKNTEFTLSLTQFKKLCKTKTCYYTGIILDIENQNSPNYLTLDRIDSTIGYTKNNTVAATSCANQFKALFESGNYPVSMEQAKAILTKTLQHTRKDNLCTTTESLNSTN